MQRAQQHPRQLPRRITPFDVRRVYVVCSVNAQAQINTPQINTIASLVLLILVLKFFLFVATVFLCSSADLCGKIQIHGSINLVLAYSFFFINRQFYKTIDFTVKIQAIQSSSSSNYMLVSDLSNKYNNDFLNCYSRIPVSRCT